MSDLAVVDVSVSPVDKFREFLKTQGKRLTHEREIIVEEVFSSHEHFDAEQLVNRVSQRGPSRPTVYRTLSWLEKAGLLRKVARAEGRDVYEHDYGYPQHDHLICSKCGQMIEFHNEAISNILDEIATEMGFRMTGHRLEVSGMCKECSRPPKRRHQKLDLL